MDLEAIDASLEQKEILGGKLLASPGQELFQAQVLASADLLRLVDRGAFEDRGGVDIGVAVHADEPAIAGRRRASVNLHGFQP